MPRYDQDTLEFMSIFDEDAHEKTAEDKKEEAPAEDKHLSLKPIRMAKQIVKGIEHPDKAIGKILVRAAANALMEKGGSMRVLDIYRFMNDHYKREWWDWEPETIWTMLESEHLDKTHDDLKEIIMALQVVLNTFAPFEHWHIFENVGHAFNGNPVMFSIVQPLEPNEIALTIHILSKIRPNTEYDSEILQYISACAKHAGMVFLPDDLFAGAQKFLDDITFEHGLRDAVRKMWENPKGGVPPVKDVTKEQIEIQIYRLLDVKKYLVKEAGSA